LAAVKAVPLVVLVLLAGCTTTDADERTTPTDGPPLGADESRSATGSGALPVWQVGDWWSYQVDYASGESHLAKLIVYDEDSANYYVTADDRALILRAAFTHYPTLGAVAKTDLSQTIHGVKVEALRFPMMNGTWSGAYRDFPATWTTTAATLPTGKGPVEGFITTMRNDDDGLVRITNGWSAATQWYTHFIFDFDGVAPADVTYTLLDWGSDFRGTFPVVEVIDHVHRPFPTLAVAPPDVPQAPDALDALADFEIQDGSILWGFFAAAGGPGLFRIQIGHESSGAYHEMEWRPGTAGGTFQWEEIEAPDAGSWGLSATGVAQSSAFLFVEAYEVRTTTATR
jgi:hypothetical protein